MRLHRHRWRDVLQNREGERCWALRCERCGATRDLGWLPGRMTAAGEHDLDDVAAEFGVDLTKEG